MREELLGPKVEDIAFAVIPEKNEDGGITHYVYLINYKQEILEGIIVTSVGYGQNANTGEKVKTSMLRHCIEILLPDEAAKIEPIMDEVFGLSNEYWLSFWINDVMYDKKFIFLPETIQEKNMQMIPEINKKGVIIQ
ncbi:MAG: hypothetical protein ACI9XP_001954 [Lentimonas sp.]|jgi:hypothetical protein